MMFVFPQKQIELELLMLIILFQFKLKMKAAFLLIAIALALLHNVDANCNDKTPPCTCKVGEGMWKGGPGNCNFVYIKEVNALLRCSLKMAIVTVRTILFVALVVQLFSSCCSSTIEVNFPDDAVISQAEDTSGETNSAKFFVYNFNKNKTITIEIWSND
ncbi:hypothetical protein RN001_015006 [Aquatica leii]|uniref:Uncharacterized protein n=1 Tax=Aquatica leii TaxID=1421715 RepID=A0AAN7PQ34_9COLE|nr:hypothetical protein RN001_015006 [Aquatica leii]